MNDFRQFSTERLSLRAVRPRDANQIFWLNSDPRAWAHRPSGVHTSREQTMAQVGGYLAAWDRDGLGCWAARTHDGTFVGIGGCSVKEGVWCLAIAISGRSRPTHPSDLMHCKILCKIFRLCKICHAGA